jgi:hypothetical protein
LGSSHSKNSKIIPIFPLQPKVAFDLLNPCSPASFSISFSFFVEPASHCTQPTRFQPVTCMLPRSVSACYWHAALSSTSSRRRPAQVIAPPPLHLSVPPSPVLSYPGPKKLNRSFHRCAQEVTSHVRRLIMVKHM